MDWSFNNDMPIYTQLVDKIKLSLRAKSRANVAVMAEHLGGGGHTKAAGGTMKMTLEEALPLIRQEVENALL